MIYDWRTGQDADEVTLRLAAKQTVSSITAAIWEFFGDPWYGKAKQTFVATTAGAWEFYSDFWGGYALAGKAIKVSTMNSHHTRLWNLNRFGGYSKR